ncbi:LOW QUALITY PROTEIN: hypothetical protein OSB04_003202 [Centaurea solstitialis]|uniref:non-specific serine/threonine protein kinase n=1 Tax=Centaurea solstitialis TaxID=347529 RepID=A0AA38U4V6_9ASTR|nr:LOW QUALITY PROTEIN: hypothetical protein OSB04_003202 [Centaurea solstitialis]
MISNQIPQVIGTTTVRFTYDKIQEVISTADHVRYLLLYQISVQLLVYNACSCYSTTDHNYPEAHNDFNALTEQQKKLSSSSSSSAVGSSSQSHGGASSGVLPIRIPEVLSQKKEVRLNLWFLNPFHYQISNPLVKKNSDCFSEKKKNPNPKITSEPYFRLQFKYIMMETKKGTILMQRYEIGRLLGQGTFAKVYYGRNLKSSQSVAVKVIDKEQVMKVGLIDQIKREISVMRLVKHPNVVQLYEVMASKSKIYFAMEYVRGGELFNKVSKGRLKEEAARKYFQQLVAAVDFCHSRGVYHRDLKPENLLLDESGNLKTRWFVAHNMWNTGLCCTEVINKKGYDGQKADIWSCGVILFVLLAAYLPFHDNNLMEMYKKISKGDFKCPQWFPPEVKKLLSKILDPNPDTRISLDKLMQNPWFRKGFKKIEVPKTILTRSKSILDIDNAIKFMDTPKGSYNNLKELDDPKGTLSSSPSYSSFSPSSSSDTLKPTSMNAFDIISLSQGFNLSGLFEDDSGNSGQKREARFTTRESPSAIISKLEEVAETDGFGVMKTIDGTVRLQGSKEGRKGQLAIDAEIFEVAPSFHVVEMKKLSGDTLEYNNFCNQDLRPSLKDIVWTWEGEQQQDAQHERPQNETLLTGLKIIIYIDNPINIMNNPTKRYNNLKELDDPKATLSSSPSFSSFASSSSSNAFKPTFMNAFDIISISQGFNLSGFSEDDSGNSEMGGSIHHKRTCNNNCIQTKKVVETKSFGVMKIVDGTVKLQGRKYGIKGT